MFAIGYKYSHRNCYISDWSNNLIYGLNFKFVSDYPAGAICFTNMKSAQDFLNFIIKYTNEDINKFFIEEF